MTVGRTQASASVIDRPRLLGLLGRPDACAVWISSLPGSGRSVLLERWCAVTGGSALPVAVPAGSPDGFASIKGQLDARFATPPLAAWFASGGAASAELRTALAAAPPVVVVVDDDRIGAPDDRYTAFFQALHGSGSALRAIVASCTAPPAGLSTMTMQDLVVELSAGELRFDVEETRQLAALLVGRDLEVDAAHDLVDHHDGWVTGLRSSLRSWAVDHRDPATGPADAQAADYVRDRVVAHLPEAARGFLEAAAALPALSVDLCDQLLADQGGGDQIEVLRTYGSLVEPLPHDPGYWRLARPIRSAVLARRTSNARATAAKLLEAGADWFADEGMVVQATACKAELKDWAGLHALLQAHGPTLFADARIDLIVDVLRQVPPHVYRQELTWAIALASMQLVGGQVAAGLDLLARVQPLLPPEDQMRADCARMVAVGWSSDMEEFLDLGTRGLAACDALGDEQEYFDVLNPSTTEHYRQLFRHGLLAAGAYGGRWDEVADQDREVPTRVRIEMSQLVLGPMLAQRAAYHALRGDALTAQALATDVLSVADQNGVGAAPATGEALLALGEALRLAARPDEARATLERGLALVEPVGRRNSVAMGVAALAHLDVDQDDPEAALQRVLAHDRSTVYAAPAHLEALLRSAQARALIRFGRLDDASAALSRAVTTADTAAARLVIALSRFDLDTAAAVLEAWPVDGTPATRVGLLAGRAALEAARGVPGRADALLRAAVD